MCLYQGDHPDNKKQGANGKRIPRGIQLIGKEGTMAIIYRDGRNEDCAALAEFVSIAAGGVIDFLYHELIPGMTPLEIERKVLENVDMPRSYKNSIVAEGDGGLLGVAISFPSSHHRITQEMREFFPEDRLAHLKHLLSSRVENSLLLDALCVTEDCRGLGVGTQLISLTRQKALKAGFKLLSLIVFADNTNARRLYEHCGFEVVEKIDVQPHALIPHEGGCLLMRCELDD
jgi:GNAT superfamily N-acetyltransferase